MVKTKVIIKFLTATTTIGDSFLNQFFYFLKNENN